MGTDEEIKKVMPPDAEVIDADRQGKSPYDFSNTVKEEIMQIKSIIDSES